MSYWQIISIINLAGIIIGSVVAVRDYLRSSYRDTIFLKIAQIAAMIILGGFVGFSATAIGIIYFLGIAKLILIASGIQT